MKRDPGGALTTICMLIPMVAVPWFAIRGTQDLPAFQSQAGESQGELSYTTDFEPADADLPDAPPFPSGSTQVVPDETVSPDNFDWDPFETGSPFDAEASGRSEGKTADVGGAGPLDEPATGLGSAEVSPGGSMEVEDPEPGPPGGGGSSQSTPPAHRASQPRDMPTAKSVTERWKEMVRHLEAGGMRNYRVEATEDRTRYFFTAFFQDGSTLRRIEGQGKHPLIALQDAVRQVSEWRSSQ